ncbi:hypothetical protein DWZ75_07065 [Bacteroides stercoris]|nr:hypothetical protein DWZ75_07065 [Bacteroides stercoris]HAX56713.1 hypothetical protein [Bacteroides stercoris]
MIFIIAYKEIKFRQAVRAIPSGGTGNTNSWYEEYQRLVQTIPKRGTRSTNRWYGVYRAGEHLAACRLAFIVSVSRFRLR